VAPHLPGCTSFRRSPSEPRAASLTVRPGDRKAGAKISQSAEPCSANPLRAKSDTSRVELSLDVISPPEPSQKSTMQAVSIYAGAVVTAAMMTSASGPCAQDSKLAVPNVTVTAPAAPVEPPYMRDPAKAYWRNPYFGRYRVEDDKFSEVPCTQTRIAFGPGGKCLQGYRLGFASNSMGRNSNTCDMALDVVIDTTGKLSIEAATVQAEDINYVFGPANPDLRSTG